MHDVVIVGIPLFAILAGILFNRNDVKGLRAEMKDLRNDIGSLRSEVRGEIKDVRGEIKELRTEMRDGFAHIDADLRQFFHVTGKLEGRIDEIAKR